MLKPKELLAIVAIFLVLFGFYALYVAGRTQGRAEGLREKQEAVHDFKVEAVERGKAEFIADNQGNVVFQWKEGPNAQKD